MSGGDLQRINLNVQSSWRSTLTQAFQILRRIPFVTEDTFSFGDFDPQLNFNGMVATALNIRRARYLKILNMFWYSFDIEFTLAAPLTSIITMMIPYTVAGDSASVQTNVVAVDNAVLDEPGIISAAGGTNLLFIRRGSGRPNYTAVASLILSNGFLEVI